MVKISVYPEQSLWPLRYRPTTWQRRLCCYDASTT